MLFFYEITVQLDNAGAEIDGFFLSICFLSYYHLKEIIQEPKLFFNNILLCRGQSFRNYSLKLVNVFGHNEE